jgi:hypothetical protein
MYADTYAGRWSARKAGRVRSGGFPCRFVGCRECFVVSIQGSMPALTAASLLRTQHEVAAHNYQHVRLEEHPRGLQTAVRFVPKRTTP